MATISDLDELLTYLARESEGMTLLEFKDRAIGELRRRHPGEKIYIQPPDTSKREAIERAVRTLPTSVVAERFGVTRDYARKVGKGIKKRD